jgi:undecaprenyl-diphosphatase
MAGEVGYHTRRRARRAGAMSQIDVVCAVIRSPLVHWIMVAVDRVGDGWVATALGAAVLAWGLVSRHDRRARAGAAALLGLLLAGLCANALKTGLQWERPLGGSYGFPSGHSGSAFALAGALGYAWPPAAPWLGVLAVLAGAARVYFRAHFLNDVLAGGALGLLSGMLAGRLVVGARRARRPAAWRGWAAASVVALAVLGLLAWYERDLRAYRVERPPAEPTLTLAFGQPEARARLVAGWSDDQMWNGAFPMVWAQGLESAIALPGLPSRPHALQLRVAPFARGRRGVCQRMTVLMNGETIARVALERGWWDYRIPVPARSIMPGRNELRLRFAYAEQPGWTGAAMDLRPLAVAFARLDLAPGAPP